MNNHKDRHHQEHQHRIKDIDKRFCGEQNPIGPLDILCHPEDRSDEDQNARYIQGIHVLRPGDVIANRLRCRMGDYAPLEDHSADQEEAEEDDLHNQAADDNVVSGAFGSVDHDSGAFVVSIRFHPDIYIYI